MWTLARVRHACDCIPFVVHNHCTLETPSPFTRHSFRVVPKIFVRVYDATPPSVVLTCRWCCVSLRHTCGCTWDMSSTSEEDARTWTASDQEGLDVHVVHGTWTTTCTWNDDEDDEGEAEEEAAEARDVKEAGVQTKTRLHVEVAACPQHLGPCASERARAHALRDAVALCARRAFGKEAHVRLFGSHAQGLALAGGDCDLVVLGVGPMARLGGTFGRRERTTELLPKLDALRKELKRSGVAPKKAQRIDARVPILKCASADGMPFDVNVGAANGVRAVEFVRKGMEEHRGMGPVVLCIKRFLRERKLNEVFTGGMGSYTLFNLVWAHLSAMRIARQDTEDLGVMLYQFFVRFGFTFDYHETAVSLRRGGFVKKEKGWPGKPGALQVEDPQEPGKDIAQGTYRIASIAHEFRNAAKTLENYQWNAQVLDGNAHLPGGLKLLNRIFKASTHMNHDSIAKPPRSKALLRLPAHSKRKQRKEHEQGSPAAKAKGRKKATGKGKKTKNSAKNTHGKKRKNGAIEAVNGESHLPRAKKRKVHASSQSAAVSAKDGTAPSEKRRFKVGQNKGKVHWQRAQNKGSHSGKNHHASLRSGQKRVKDGHSKSFGWHTGRN